ncbi:limonoid UDP-glucosyltransferase [Panicum miliaceum]|uniref:Glycosyltransferase n=1 Tax=Panicum miliaceum TaxID=4540 RepID=A0A3L6RSP4_PANMI|nr:limonoid UDP-glucosyltransferase [Panicum miliaceum]
MGEEAAVPPVVAAAAAAGAPPHLLLICFPGQGHVNPMLRLAKRVAAKGLLVTFSSLASVGARLAAAAGVSAGGDGVPVGRGRVRFEFLEDGDPGPDLDDLMRHLETAGPPAFAALLRRQAEEGRPVACVVVNPFMPWASDVAAAEGIPTAVLWVQSCAVFSLYYHHVHGLVEFPPEDDPAARFKLPGLPEMSVTDVPSFLLPSNPFKLLADAIITQFRTIGRATWVLVNSFAELEADVVAALPGVTPRPPELIPVGPLIELQQGEEDEEEEDSVRGDLIKAADDCVGWLDAQPPRSVVYASVGSVVVLSPGEVAEMAHGLASTGRPFLWVVRPDTRPHLPAGFLDSVSGRGAVVPWSPQERVLAHPSTACFLTHCGWNSTLETVAAGVPVVAFPQWGDQCTDARFLVEELVMGVRLRAAPAGLRREAVRDAVEAAVAGPRAGDMLASARRWSAAARAAVAPGGSSDANVQAFVDEVARRACGGGAAKAQAQSQAQPPPAVVTQA